MMNDKDLLELAAKAASYKVTAYDWQFGCRVIDGGVYKDWNPIKDDGEALRLAVKLRIPILNGIEWTVDSDDPCAATRRAIVLAAAAIGRSSTVK